MCPKVVTILDSSVLLVYYVLNLGELLAKRTLCRQTFLLFGENFQNFLLIFFDLFFCWCLYLMFSFVRYTRRHLSQMSLFSKINESKCPGEFSWRSKNIIYWCNELSRYRSNRSQCRGKADNWKSRGKKVLMPVFLSH